ncbi:helix-turn-helix domain-containing protein [Actinomadura sp. 1N219]|uniref:helix-turn-helix domain-containing protein n=1 Tax=Actinomadura sp. 1N219 TaxID=3375152 RepID=UPI00378C078E
MTREAVPTIGPKLLRVPQVMEALQLSRWRVYELIRSGALESIKVGRDRRVPVDALDTFIAQLREDAA